MFLESGDTRPFMIRFKKETQRLLHKDFSKNMNGTTDASELGYGGQLERNFKMKETDLDDIRPIE